MSATKKATKKKQTIRPTGTEKPTAGYLDDKQIKLGVAALKDYIKKSRELRLSCAQKKDLLEAGERDSSGLSKVFVEVVFKNVPENSKTYIHNVVLPNHWRLKAEPEDSNIAIFVRHRRADTEVQKLQFARDRDLDIDNTHNYYKQLFEDRLTKETKSRISRIITMKELATEFNTFQKLDRLSKTYDLFLSDKQLMANKMNPLPRRLGRRFWVREKKVPLMVKLNVENLEDRFTKALSTEPFYVVGKNSTEHIQIGLVSQPNRELVENFRAFLDRLFELYRDSVRFIRLRSEKGTALPLFADLSTKCPKVLRRRKVRPKPVVDDFDMLSGAAKVAVYRDGTVKVMRSKRKRPTARSSPDKPLKRVKS